MELGYGDNYGDSYGNPNEQQPITQNLPAAPYPINYYIKLITSQYQLSFKFLDWLTAVLSKLFDASSFIDYINFYSDIDNAVLYQLDIIGVIVGQVRTVNFQPSGGLSPVLDDEHYRILLKAKIAQNIWDGKVSSLYTMWNTIFPEGNILINDSQDMSAVITIAGNFDSMIEDLINNGYIVPRPQGVQYNFGFGDLPFFGFDRDDDYVSGFDKGKIT